MVFIPVFGNVLHPIPKCLNFRFKFFDHALCDNKGFFVFFAYKRWKSKTRKGNPYQRFRLLADDMARLFASRLQNAPSMHSALSCCSPPFLDPRSELRVPRIDSKCSRTEHGQLTKHPLFWLQLPRHISWDCTRRAQHTCCRFLHQHMLFEHSNHLRGK